MNGIGEAMLEPLVKSTPAQHVGRAPHPFVGEEWGGGFQLDRSLLPSPSLSLPHKGGGDCVAAVFAARAQQARRGLSA
jgi:hypothetical protein